MANIPNRNLMYFHSSDLQIKIVQKSANPPNMQHHMLRAFSDTTVGGKKKKQEKKKARRALLFKAFSLPLPENLRIMLRRGTSRGAHTDTSKPKGFPQPQREPCACSCLAGNSRETYSIERTYLTAVLYVYLGKYFKQQKILHCEIS